MGSLSFDELRWVFQNGTVWGSNYEMYWYEYAWGILERQGKTAYKNERECYEVRLRALALIRVYYQFSEIVFGESREDYIDFIDDELPELVIGQILGGLIGADEIYEDVEEALICLLDAMKYDVFKSLKAELTASDAFAWMYCTGDDSYFDEDAEIFSMSDYEKAVTSAEDAVVNDWCVGHAVDAFDYVCRLMRD